MNTQAIDQLVHKINKMATGPIRIMEVCGTHTHAIARLGIKDILSPHIELISGPGCPVCVTAQDYIDSCIGLLDKPRIMVASFGDMARVRGSKESLWEKKSQGKRVELIYSPEDVIKLASDNKEWDIVFAGVGFETTAPLIACTIKRAKDLGLSNLFFFTALKRMSPIIDMIMNHDRTKVDGVICPGNVAVITGEEPFRLITHKYNTPAVICGFEAMDIISSIYILMKQISGDRPLCFINNYPSCVNREGNKVAKQIIEEVFEVQDTLWRGIGRVPGSALVMREEYASWDAAKRWHIQEEKNHIPSQCACHEILLGIKTPQECPSFGKACTPDQPIGPCMVSGEGACAAHYHYRRL